MAEVLPDIEHDEKTGEKSSLEPGWLVICWNDPVNLMTYVTHVFQTVFGWNQQRAETHMLEVHRKGKSVLARTTMEKAEHYVHQLQKYTLHATMERVVKLLRANGRGYTFHLLQREKKALFNTLALYPLVPQAYRQLSKTIHGQNDEENQRLLEEALAEHREETRQHVLALLKKSRRFRKKKPGFEVTFKRVEVEWLLQVLNDVRVGRWIALGEPDLNERPAITAENAEFHLRLYLCEGFQSILLRALGVNQSPQWSD